MLNSKETIDSLETINKRLGFKCSGISNAVKVIRMWEKFIQRYGSYHLPGCFGPDRNIRELTNKIEEEYFPSIIHQNVSVDIEGENEDHLRKTRECIKDVWGVTEVRANDTRY